MTRVQPEGPASKILQPGDKIIQVFCCPTNHKNCDKSCVIYCAKMYLAFFFFFFFCLTSCLFLQVNGYSFVNIDHGNAVALLKTFPNTVDLTIIREMQA